MPPATAVPPALLSLILHAFSIPLFGITAARLYSVGIVLQSPPICSKLSPLPSALFFSPVRSKLRPLRAVYSRPPFCSLPVLLAWPYPKPTQKYPWTCPLYVFQLEILPKLPLPSRHLRANGASQGRVNRILPPPFFTGGFVQKAREEYKREDRAILGGTGGSSSTFVVFLGLVPSPVFVPHSTLPHLPQTPLLAARTVQQRHAQVNWVSELNGRFLHRWGGILFQPLLARMNFDGSPQRRGNQNSSQQPSIHRSHLDAQCAILNVPSQTVTGSFYQTKQEGMSAVTQRRANSDGKTRNSLAAGMISALARSRHHDDWRARYE
ncbi:hypothetical protein C8J57DRAFT_1226329 [Mycena rebaudengoi]|nr:hypothetical protein C8J57DRAFT_1226329 [Mycena rebaudengoi]